jgi:[acyl-carrier-protein] S-malonyltransferase
MMIRPYKEVLMIHHHTEIAMNCFMFPGQPFSGSAVLPDDDDWHQIAEMVRQFAHFDLASFSWIGVQGTDQVGLQVQGVASSLHQLRLMAKRGIQPTLVAPHSMGIYPALVACGSLSEADAIEITWRVGSCLAPMGKIRSYAFGSVIGLPLELLQGMADNNWVHVANHNTARHFLLSGEKSRIDQAVTEAQANGAFSARSFDCDAPLHSPLVAQREAELEAIFSGYRFREPALPLMSHVDQRYLRAADIPDFLGQQLQLPVFWERSYRALCRAGAAVFFELGEGESLRKFNRWIDGDP